MGKAGAQERNHAFSGGSQRRAEEGVLLPLQFTSLGEQGLRVTQTKDSRNRHLYSEHQAVYSPRVRRTDRV